MSHTHMRVSARICESMCVRWFHQGEGEANGYMVLFSSDPDNDRHDWLVYTIININITKSNQLINNTFKQELTFMVSHLHWVLHTTDFVKEILCGGKGSKQRGNATW